MKIKVGGCYKNIKNNSLYIVLDDKVINSTNDNDGQVMVLYFEVENHSVYVREKEEFLEKFEIEKEVKK